MLTPNPPPSISTRSHPTSPNLLGALTLLKTSPEYTNKQIETLYAIYMSKMSLGPYTPSNFEPDVEYPYFSLFSLITNRADFTDPAKRASTLQPARDELVKRIKVFLAQPYSHYHPADIESGDCDFYVDLTDSVLDGSLSLPPPPTYPASEPLATDTMVLVPLVIMVSYNGLSGANGQRNPFGKAGEGLQFWAPTWPSDSSEQEIPEPRCGSFVVDPMHMGSGTTFQYPSDINKPLNHRDAGWRRFRYDFQYRQDDGYPKHRLELFMLLFEEMFLLMDELTAIQKGVAKLAKGFMEGGEKGEAERVVRSHVDSFIGGRCREVLDRTAFFMEAIHYINKARAPSVDTGIYRHLYGISRAVELSR